MDATPQPTLQTLTNTASNNSSQGLVLLPTAEIYVLDNHGKKHIARALLDSASQSSFITQGLADKLGLQRHHIDISVTGIKQNSLPIKHRTEITFESKHGDFTTDLSCLLLDHITSNLPHLSFSNKNISIPDYVNLADIRYNEAREIDILLGADIFWDLLLDGQIKTTKRGPVLQNTRLGWVISGCFPCTTKEIRKFLYTRLNY